MIIDDYAGLWKGLMELGTSFLLTFSIFRCLFMAFFFFISLWLIIIIKISFILQLEFLLNTKVKHFLPVILLIKCFRKYVAYIQFLKKKKIRTQTFLSRIHIRHYIHLQHFQFSILWLEIKLFYFFIFLGKKKKTNSSFPSKMSTPVITRSNILVYSYKVVSDSELWSSMKCLLQAIS